MGGKKRKSVNNNASSQNVASIKQSLSGEDSDYGVLSDPDEGLEYNRPIEEPSSPVVIPEGVSIDTKDIMINEIKCEEETTKINMVDTDNKHATTTTTTEESKEVITQSTDINNKNNSESAPAQEDPESVFDKSLEHLKIKLEKDTEFSKKMVHTTFLTFLILAMEIDDNVTNSFSRISSAEAYETQNVERLIDYMIKTHSATPEVEQYTRTMLQLGVITHIIKGLIGFNLSLLDKNEKNPSIIRPYLNELERLNKEKCTENAKKQSPSAEADVATAAKPNKIIQFWRNITCCCRCKRSRKNSILESVDTESKEMKDTTMSNDKDGALTPL
jgi:hypothetical protein